MWERACSRRRCISNNQAARPTAIAGKPAPTFMGDRPKSPHPPQSKCGSGLAREAVYLHQPSRLTHRLREQARSHTNERQTKISAPTAIQMWERACPRSGVSAPTKPPDPTPSQSSQLPHLLCDCPKSPHPPQSKCGSGLAREGGVSVTTKPPHPPPSSCGSRACPRWQSSSQPSTSGPTAFPSTRTPAFFRLCFNIWDANLYIEIFQKMGL